MAGIRRSDNAFMATKSLLSSFRGAPTGPRKARPDDRLRASPESITTTGSMDSGPAPSGASTMCNCTSGNDECGTLSSIFKQHHLQTQLRDLAARFARVLLSTCRPLRSEGVGNAGRPWHPRPRVHFVLVESTRATTSTPESPDVPARNGFTAYFVLSPATGLFCHRRPTD